MPDLSKKAIEMPASPIRKLVPFSEAAQKRGIKIYHLNIGQPDIETPEEYWTAVRNFSNKVLEYSHSAGNESYRRKLAEYYKSYQINVEYSDILITTGGSEAVLFGFYACMNPGDEVIIPEPFYTNYNAFAIMAGVKIRPITAYIENGFALPPISEFEKLITPKTKAILICNPNNPTGYLYSKEELEQLRELALKYDLFLFADEVYREMVYDGQNHTSILTLPGLEKHAVVFDSISKRYSACGARVGAIVSKNRELMVSVLKFGQARLCPPTLDQAGAEASIDVPPAYFENIIEEYSSRRNLMVEALNKMEGVICPKPGGAFYAIVRLPVDDSEKFCQWMLESFNYQGQTVMMAPAPGFYATPGCGKNEVRIAYVLKKENLEKAMICLEQALLQYPGRTI
ncbi:MAG TPA: pyridoxal phosphate-dependent aminotransferase [Bacteroidia bacterium]|nr:pyridoxal phosphate-dependent aminotransferase [Bacteroidia bacterium]HRS58106.1 pyridoxal phosphate-dependent aminotransferase [Bacteroidia bacterium]HRU66873.1 pyridoxal phosphate-dependent aminotransferase [Bacteroidia bacterium]